MFFLDIPKCGGNSTNEGGMIQLSNKTIIVCLEKGIDLNNVGWFRESLPSSPQVNLSLWNQIRELMTYLISSRTEWSQEDCVFISHLPPPAGSF